MAVHPSPFDGANAENHKGGSRQFLLNDVFYVLQLACTAWDILQNMLEYDSNLSVLGKLLSWDMILDTSPTLQLGSLAVPALERKFWPQMWPCGNSAYDAISHADDDKNSLYVTMAKVSRRFKVFTRCWSICFSVGPWWHVNIWRDFDEVYDVQQNWFFQCKLFPIVWHAFSIQSPKLPKTKW